jgi:hypothetical protein
VCQDKVCADNQQHLPDIVTASKDLMATQASTLHTSSKASTAPMKHSSLIKTEVDTPDLYTIYDASSVIYIYFSTSFV